MGQSMQIEDTVLPESLVLNPIHSIVQVRRYRACFQQDALYRPHVDHRGMQYQSHGIASTHEPTMFDVASSLGCFLGFERLSGQIGERFRTKHVHDRPGCISLHYWCLRLQALVTKERGSMQGRAAKRGESILDSAEMQ